MGARQTKSKQETFEDFNELPDVLKNQIASYVSILDLSSLSRTSKGYNAFFQPLMDVHRVLFRFSPKCIETIYKRLTITDCSLRTFENCSPFEYALWALDKHCWTMMLGCIRAISDEKEKDKVLKILSGQYDRVKKEGLTYTFHGKTITEKHFDFENTIINQLKIQVDSQNAPGAKDWDAINKQWIEGVGGAQRLLPLHAVFEYCSDKPFYPVPDFKSPPKQSQQFYNGITEKTESWFGAISKLGREFAIYKASSGGSPRGLLGVCVVRRVSRGCGAYNLDSMKELCKVRTQDFINLKSEFETQKPVDNQKAVFQN